MANTMKIKVENGDVLTHAVQNSIDTSNTVSSGNGDGCLSSGYTATEDCWMVVYHSINSGELRVDGGNIWLGMSQNWHSYLFPVSKGSTVTYTGGRSECKKYVVFGVKR